jgi:hypothetical protein
MRPLGNAAALVREIASLILGGRQIRRMRTEGSHVRPLRKEFRRFFILLCTFVFLVIARFGNWEVHAAGVGQLLQNADTDPAILAELQSIRMWLSLIPIALMGLAFIGVFALFLAPIFHKFHQFGRISGSGAYRLEPRRRLPGEPRDNRPKDSFFS